MINIPMFRAKKIDSDEYVVGSGFYRGILEQYPMSAADCRIINVIVENGTMWHIDPSTLAINFPDMLDIQGNKIFASLNEDGRGGDVATHQDYGLNKYIFIYHKEFEFGISLIREQNTDFDCWEYSPLQDEYLSLFEIIGIQK